MTVRLAAPCLLAAFLGCATVPEGPPLRMTEMPAEPPPKGGEFTAMGEIQYVGPGGPRSAAYGAWRIVGPTVNVAYTGGGTWAGSLDGRTVSLQAAPGRLTGAGVDLFLYQEGDVTTVRGIWFQRSVWLTVSSARLNGHSAGAPGIELTRESPSVWNGIAGAGIPASLVLKGEAARFPAVPAPQFHLALMAALP